jgi:S1-C subfamily serine protease
MGLFARASPSVMLLTVYDANGTPLREGTAFVVDDAGTLATSADVAADAAIVEVKAPDASVHVASAVLASDADADLALLRMEGGSYAPLRLAEGDPPAADTPVHVVGSAVQLHTALFSGVVLGMRAGTGGALMIEISNQLYPVTSGAPLLDNDGLVLGVAVFAANRAQDVNLAAPVKALRAMLASSRNAAPLRALGTLTNDMRTRVEGATALRSKILSECTPSDVVNTDRVIHDTLAVGTPPGDGANALGPFRLYEGAAYKLLYLLADRCPSASSALSDAVAASARDDNPAHKVAVIRYAFDAILGVPTDANAPQVP